MHFNLGFPNYDDMGFGTFKCNPLSLFNQILFSSVSLVFCHISDLFFCANNGGTWTEKDHVERTSLQAATVGVSSETCGGKIEGVDTFFDSTVVGNPSHNIGISAFDNTSGAGGLGEGTPK
ncbi:hypothetical protein U1Q18_020031, partial [Sarracenia purpurea var. burkii]